MTISACPSCHEPVSVPQGAGGSARVRCPLCAEEFSLSVVLDKLPPMLVLLDAPVPATTAASDSGVSFASEAATRPAGAPAFEFEESAAPGARKTITPSARPKRREKSVVVEMIKVVGGGVVGLVLAVLILWHVAKRDPFNLGPKVAAYVPWIVPQGMRGKAEVKTDDKNDKTDSNGSSSSQQNSGKDKGIAKGNGDISDKAKGAKSPGSGDAIKPVATKPEEKIEDPGKSTEPSPTDEDNLNIGSPVVGPKPKETKPKDVEPKDPEPDESEGPKRSNLAKSFPPATASDLERALKSVELANNDIELALSPAAKDLSNEKKHAFVEAYFNAFTHLGEVLVRVDQDDPEIQGAAKNVEGVLKDLAKVPSKVKILATLTERSLKATKRANRGLCLAGKVTRIEPSGKLYEIEVELATTGKTPFQVLATEDPDPQCKVGDTLLLLGAIVSNPKKNLAGYEGEDTEARCVHVFVPLPADSEKPEPLKPERTKPDDKPNPEEDPEKPADSPDKPADPPTKPAKSTKPADEEAK